MGLVGWYGERDDREAAATVTRALDLGVSHLDTAAVYQDGDNERFVGDCIRGRRNEVFLATKCGMERSPEGRLRIDNHPELIRRSCEASLSRLGTDHIDLFYLHRIDPQVPVEDSIGVLAELVAAGKIRYVGLSEACPETLERAHAVHPIAALQSELSLWTRATARSVLEKCRELDVAFVAYSPLGRGFLTGAVRTPEDLPEGDTRRIFPRFAAENFADNVAAADRVAEIAGSMNISPAQLALAWVLAQWDGILPIPGTKRRKYLEENVAAAEIELTAGEIETLGAVFGPEAVTGDRYPAGALQKVQL